MRATDRLTEAAAEHKVRIKDLVRQLLPMTPLTGELGAADLVVLEACVKLRQQGIVLKRVDAPYVPGVRSDAWRKVKTAAWRTEHGPRRLPKEIRERIVLAQLEAMRPT